MTGTYEIIYADPPWRYSAKKVQGAAENHYPTMSIEELCALPVADLAAKDADIHQFIISPIEAHSKKPDETRDKIVALMGDRPRVELFARQTPPGWDVWGNEVEPTAGLWSRWPEDSGKEDVSCPM